MRTLENFSLLNHNTFGVDVTANYFVEYDNITELQQLLGSDLLKENKFFHIEVAVICSLSTTMKGLFYIRK